MPLRYVSTVQYQSGVLWLYVCYDMQEAELESIQLQSNVEQLKEEKERILNSLVEAE